MLCPVAADYTEIKNDFMASRESLPVMFLATPKDRKLSIWTKQAPSVQVSMHIHSKQHCKYGFNHTTITITHHLATAIKDIWIR